MTVPQKLVVVLSGGLDSTTLLYDAVAQGADVVRAVSFNYGQRHKKELDYAKQSAEKLSIKHTVIDLWSSGLTEAFSNSESSLVTDTDVPEGHYGEESMKATVVPNRNMIMLSIAGGIAVADGANAVATGVHAGDHFIYPDCRPAFISTAASALALGNDGFGSLDVAPIFTPYIFRSKNDIAFRAIELDVPLHETWSCYNGRENHCGRCGTCVERLESIDWAVNKFLDEYNVEVEDHTMYEDDAYWREALKRETV